MARRKRRWLLRLFLFAFALAAAVVLISPFVPLDSLKPQVESRLSSTLGRKVTVGSLRMSLLGGPYLIINDLTAKEDAEFGDGNFIEAERVSADLVLSPLLLSREVAVEGLEIKSPRITIAKNGEGVLNWTTIGQPTASSGRADASRIAPAMSAMIQSSLFKLTARLDVRSVEVENATLRFSDGPNAQSPDSLYQNVAITASISPSAEGSDAGSRVTGSLRAQSEESEGAQLFKADLPFDLVISRNSRRILSAQGNVGPGSFETKNFNAGSFKSKIDLKGNRVIFEEMEIGINDGRLRGKMEANLASYRFSTAAEVENLNLDEALASKLQAAGQITGHINAKFNLAGELRSFEQTVQTLSGSGQLSSKDMILSSVNISEQVARALQISGIGDMNPGTTVGSLETGFRLERGVIKTDNLRLREVDGLGDATAAQGEIRVASAPALNYTASVRLSSEATEMVKSSSPLLGAVIAMLERDKRITIPVSITGDVRDPKIRVDIGRLR